MIIHLLAIVKIKREMKYCRQNVLNSDRGLLNLGTGFNVTYISFQAVYQKNYTNRF